MGRLRRPTSALSYAQKACPGVVYRAYDCSGSLGHVAVKAPELPRALLRAVVL